MFKHVLGDPLFCKKNKYQIWMECEGQEILDEILKSPKKNVTSAEQKKMLHLIT